MKKIIISLILSLCILSGYAQDTPNAFADRINYIFQFVDKSQVSTGVLQEYGIDFTNVNNFSGQVLNDSNKLVLNEWKYLYQSLYSAQINLTANLPQLTTIEANVNAVANNRLLVMHYNFNSIKTDALSNNLFTALNDQLYDVNGRSQSPY